MRYVPSITPPLPASADEVEVRPVRYARPPQPVGERSIPPLLFQLRPPSTSAAPVIRGESPPTGERRLGAERRKFCRRIDFKGVDLYDTRATEERRRKNRRDGDLKTIIEDKA